MSFSSTPAEPTPSRVLVIGVGNRYRGDDAVGVLAAERIQALALPGVDARSHSGEGTSLVAAWDRPDTALVVVVDAAASGAAPGTIARHEITQDMFVAEQLFTTHGIGVAQAIELAQALGRLPRRLLLYTVAGQSFATGSPLSPAVEAALNPLVDRIYRAVLPVVRAP